MRIYHYLFFKSYQLAQRSKNFDDMPVLGGTMFVVACVMLNLFALSFILEGFGLINLSFAKNYKLVFALGLLLAPLFYYKQGGRYKRIIQHYEDQERQKGKGIHPIVIFIIYFYNQ